MAKVWKIIGIFCFRGQARWRAGIWQRQTLWWTSSARCSHPISSRYVETKQTRHHDTPDTSDRPDTQKHQTVQTPWLTRHTRHLDTPENQDTQTHQTPGRSFSDILLKLAWQIFQFAYISRRRLEWWNCLISHFAGDDAAIPDFFDLPSRICERDGETFKGPGRHDHLGLQRLHPVEFEPCKCLVWLSLCMSHMSQSSQLLYQNCETLPKSSGQLFRWVV